MKKPYAEFYLSDSMNILGEAFDYATECKLSTKEFFSLFIQTGIAEQFQKGNPRYISGYSGTELVKEVCLIAGLDIFFPKEYICYDATKEYWCGFILAYFSWSSGKSFKEIEAKIGIDKILKLYNPLHEASEEKTLDILLDIFNNSSEQNKLSYQRKIAGLSQRQLSDKAQINIRTLQQYEIGQKNLDHANVTTLLNLSTILGCKIEDII